MSDWTDFIFGKKALKKAAGTASDTSQPQAPANIDIAKMAQDQANKLQGTGPTQPAPDDKKKKKQNASSQP